MLHLSIISIAIVAYTNTFVLCLTTFYIVALDFFSKKQLPHDHSDAVLRDFASRHFGMMKLMSKHLVHRKKTISSRDYEDGPSLLQTS